MTTALRTIDSSPARSEAPVPAVQRYDITDAARELARLERHVAALGRDLTSARARNATLMRELRRMVEAPSIVGHATVDKMPTLFYSSGRVLQCQPTAEYDADSTTYAHRWVEITPVPDTPQAIVDAAIASVERDDSEVNIDALPYLGGMEVVA